MSNRNLLGWFFALMLVCRPRISLGSDTEHKPAKPGVKEVQVRFASLKPSATIKIGGTADWVLITDDTVWVAATKPFAVKRVDPRTNKIVATVRVPGEPCSGLTSGFGSIWVPVCGNNPALIRIDVSSNTISSILWIAPAGPEGGITASEDSVWMVTDDKGTLSRIDPAKNRERGKISIPYGSYNPAYSNGIVWVTGTETSVLTAVSSTTGKVLKSIAVGPKPRFLTTGGGSVWTLNQGDGTISRVDENSGEVIATIRTGIPGTGGDLAYCANSVWLSVFEVPLTRVDAASNKVVRQWIGKGGDSLRCGFDSIWITDYKKGLLFRVPLKSTAGDQGSADSVANGNAVQ